MVAEDCADVLFIGVRGSGEGLTTDDEVIDSGFGPGVSAIRDGMREDLPRGVRVRQVFIEYPAYPVFKGDAGPSLLGDFDELRLLVKDGEYFRGVMDGVDRLIRTINLAFLSCSSSETPERIVLAGYSSGALAIHLALTSDRLLWDDAQQLNSVVLIADPARAHSPEVGSPSLEIGGADSSTQGLYWRYAALAPDYVVQFGSHLMSRTIDVCAQKDPVCVGTVGNLLELNRLNDAPIHTSYGTSTYGDPNTASPVPRQRLLDIGGIVARRVLVSLPLQISGQSPTMQPARFVNSRCCSSGIDLGWDRAVYGTGGVVDGFLTRIPDGFDATEIRAFPHGRGIPSKMSRVAVDGYGTTYVLYSTLGDDGMVTNIARSSIDGTWNLRWAEYVVSSKGDLAVGPNGDLFQVSDTSVWRYDRSTGGIPAIYAATGREIHQITFDALGNLFALNPPDHDTPSASISRIRSDGHIDEEWAVLSGYVPTYNFDTRSYNELATMTTSAGGTTYFVALRPRIGRTIARILPSGEVDENWYQIPAEELVGGSVTGVAVDSFGNVLVALRDAQDFTLIGELRIGATPPLLRFGSVQAANIWGAGTVGSILRSDEPWWSPVATFSYQWLRNGVDISSATDSTYVVRREDMGQPISLQITGSRAGFATQSAESAAIRISLPPLYASPVPVILGTPKSGELIIADPGRWMTAPVSLSYQWLRNGEVIAVDAKSQGYRVLNKDIGQDISVRVTGRKTGFEPQSRESGPVLISGFFTSAVSPEISGTPKIRQTLTARPGFWGYGVTFAYQWLRNGVPIVGATGKQLLLGPLDVSTAITVTVSGQKVSFLEHSETSLATEAVLGAKYSTCAMMNFDYPDGVARSGATVDKHLGEARSIVGMPFVSNALFELNAIRDTDKDGLACEHQ